MFDPMGAQDVRELQKLCAPSKKEGRLAAELAELDTQLALTEEELGEARRIRRARLWRKRGKSLAGALGDALAVCDNCRIPVAHLPMRSIGSRGLAYTGEVRVCRGHPPMLDWDKGEVYCSPPCARTGGVVFTPQASAPDIDGVGGGDRRTHPPEDLCGRGCGGECLLFMLLREAVAAQEAADEIDAAAAAQEAADEIDAPGGESPRG